MLAATSGVCTVVMDEAARRELRPWLAWMARGADSMGLRPGHLTLLGLLLALGSAVAAARGSWLLALGLWLVSRIPDGMDGVLARMQGTESELGGFLDIMADFAAYGAFVLGVAVGAPAARLACAALLLAYYLNGSVFLAISSLAEKRARQVVEGERSLQFVRGLTEGVETITAHGLMALTGAVAVVWLDELVWVFTGMVAITVVQRVAFGVRVLRD